MPSITIAKNDHIVGVDGMFMRVDCSDLPKGFHVLHWYDPDPYGKGPPWGEIEWVDAAGFIDISKPGNGNERISDFSRYTKYLDTWKQAKAKHDAALEMMQGKPVPPGAKPVDVIE